MKNSWKMRNNFFEGIMQFYNGEYDITLPIFYRDAASFTSIFTAPTDRVKTYMPFPGVTPLEIIPGRSLVGISAFEYRDTDIDTYNELSIATLVSYPQKQLPGLSLASQFLQNRLQLVILSLPVTTERARKGGVERGGYPKFLADIEFMEKADNRTCVVSANGNRLLTFHGKILQTQKGPRSHARLFTSMQGTPMVANIFLNQLEFAQSLGRRKSGIEIGRGHEMCELLSDLQLSENPIVYQFVPKYEAILFNTKNLMDI